MKFTIYQIDTGRVAFGGTSQTPALLLQPGQALLQGQEFTDGWLDGGQHFTPPAAPSFHHVFNYTNKQWEDPRSLQDLKTAKNLYISASRLKANQSTFTFTGKQIAVDPLSRGDIDAVHGIVVLSNGMPDKWVGGWKAVDNTFVSIPDVATWALFYKSMVGQGSINFAHAQDLKAQLAAATTIAEVDAIVW